MKVRSRRAICSILRAKPDRGLPRGAGAADNTGPRELSVIVASCQGKWDCEVTCLGAVPLGTAALRRGMIISNDPGYYKTGAFGIRIENLILVIEAAPVPHSEKPLNAFETLTLAPIDRRLIDTALMTAEERAWVDAYHARVAETIGPLVHDETRAWLKAATQPLPAL
jgi:hypothetical protein